MHNIIVISFLRFQIYKYLSSTPFESMHHPPVNQGGPLQNEGCNKQVYNCSKQRVCSMSLNESALARSQGHNHCFPTVLDQSRRT